MQKRIALAFFSLRHGGQCGVHIGQHGVVFGVFGNPQICYGFDSFKGLSGLVFGINTAKKSAYISLGR